MYFSRALEPQPWTPRTEGSRIGEMGRAKRHNSLQHRLGGRLRGRARGREVVQCGQVRPQSHPRRLPSSPAFDATSPGAFQDHWRRHLRAPQSFRQYDAT